MQPSKPLACAGLDLAAEPVESMTIGASGSPPLGQLGGALASALPMLLCMQRHFLCAMSLIFDQFCALNTRICTCTESLGLHILIQKDVSEQLEQVILTHVATLESEDLTSV